MNDEDLLRRAIDVARRAAEKGNPAFGAILVDAQGTVVMEGENDTVTESDCTGHAETNLIREASRRFGADALKDYVLYTSGEPCCMCSGALFHASVKRIVFSLSGSRLKALRGENGPPMVDLQCSEIMGRGSRPIEVVGPLLEDESAKLFGG